MAYEENKGSVAGEILLSAEDYASIFEEDPEENAGAAILGMTEAESAGEVETKTAGAGTVDMVEAPTAGAAEIEAMPMLAREPVAAGEATEAPAVAEEATEASKVAEEAAPEPAAVPVAEPAVRAEAAPSPSAVSVASSIAAPTAGPAAPPTTAPAVVPPTMRTEAAPAPVHLSKVVPQRLPAADGRQKTGSLEYTDCQHRQPVRISVEEDILVPDVKPDLMELLSVSARVAVAEPRAYSGTAGINSLRVSGDLLLQTLYLYQTGQGAERIAALSSKAAFRDEIPVRVEAGNDLFINARLESLDYSVINERKFRVKAVILLELCEYRRRRWEFFSGLEGEDVQLLMETAEYTDLFLRKQETLELEEEWKLKENQPEIGEILNYSINVVENHKQIGPEKAVISGTVYASVLYRPEAGEDEAGESQPVFVQEKADFTQFIRLGDGVEEAQGPVIGQAMLGLRDVSLRAVENEEGQLRTIAMQGNVDTALELYTTRRQEVVADVYHNEQEIQCQTGTEELSVLQGSGSTELTARSTIDVPEKYGGVGQVLYVTGYPVTERSWVESGRVLTEGKVPVEVVCLSAGADAQPFRLEQEIPFRTAVEIAGAEPGMDAVAEVALKELWFDKINSRQVEVNAALVVAARVYSRESYSMIKGVSLEPPAEAGEKMPSMVLYVVQPGDSLWKIAKKYRTTVEVLRDINDIQTPDLIMPGQKLLVVK